MRELALGKRPPGQQLKYRQPSALERVRRSGKVDAPNTELFLADFAPGSIGVALQAVDPVPQGACVVLAQSLRVDQLQSGAGETLDHPRHVRKLSARKDIILDEIADAAAQAIDAEPVVGDAVIEYQAAGLEDALYLAEVTRVVAHADMLEHADAGDLIELLALGQIDIIAESHANAIAESELSDLRLYMFVLILRQRNAGRPDAIALRGAKNQSAPAATDVQKLFARFEQQLAADVIELLCLRLSERIRFVPKIGARIDQILVEPETIERVRHVIMMLDVRAVTAAAV